MPDTVKRYYTLAAFYEVFDCDGRCVHVGRFHRDNPEWVDEFMEDLIPLDTCGADDCLGIWFDTVERVEVNIFV